MKQPERLLQVLLIEDSENDALLLEVELQRAGYKTVCTRVDRPEQASAALNETTWDLIIADYVMPHFNGLAALGMVKERGLDLPFIIVSGHISDDTAVAAMKAGAHDYVMKDNLARLGPAVQRELREAEIRKEQRRAEEQLRVESAFRSAIENSVPSGIMAVDLEGKQTYVNPAFCAMVDWKEIDLIGGRAPYPYWPPEEIDTITEELEKVIAGNAPAGGVEVRFRRRYGERIHVLLQVTPLKDSFGNVVGWVSSASDISERKRAEIRLAAEHAITRILANAQTLDEAGPGIVQVLLDALEMDFGALWVLDAKHESLLPAVLNVRSSQAPLRTFYEGSRRLIFTQGDGFPGRVWAERRALWARNVMEDSGIQRRQLAADAGFRNAVGFPIQNGADFFGVLEFFTINDMDLEPPLMNMMAAIGSEIGQFIQRRSAEAALRRAHDELELRVQQRTAELKTANITLQASIAERRRLEHELLEITERERRRIGLDLHDDLGQRLSGIALMTKGLQLKLAHDRAGEAEDAGRIYEMVHEAMNHASDLAHDLASLPAEKGDLTSALRHLANHARELFQISCQFKSEGAAPALEPNVVTQLYKVAQEALTNAIKHGKAKKVAIAMKTDGGSLVMSVQNDGVPFPDLHGQSTGMGLRIMNYRANLVGGSLEVKAAPSGKGTIVRCTLPTVVEKQ